MERIIHMIPRYQTHITTVIVRGVHHVVTLSYSWSCQPQEEKPASAGPSKNALKKAAKMAKKGGEKVEGATSTQPDASKSPAVSSAAPTPVPSAPSGPLMYLDSDGPGPLKCVAAARLFGVKVDAAQMNPAGEPKCSKERNDLRTVQKDVSALNFCPMALNPLSYVATEGCTAADAQHGLVMYAGWCYCSRAGASRSFRYPAFGHALVARTPSTFMPALVGSAALG